MAIVETFDLALAEGFVEAYGAGYRDIERLHHAYLGNDEITITQFQAFVGNPYPLVAKDKGYPAGQVEVVKGMGFHAKVGSEYFIAVQANCSHALFHVIILMNGKPSHGACRGVATEGCVAGNDGGEHKHILHADGIAGTQYCGNIVRIMHILHYYHEAVLAVIEDFGYFGFPFRSHSKSKVKSENQKVSSLKNKKYALP